MADSILDRIIHGSYKIKIEGKASIRQRSTTMRIRVIPTILPTRAAEKTGNKNILGQRKLEGVISACYACEENSTGKPVGAVRVFLVI